MKDKFLVNTITGWEETPRARHQVTFALARHHQVVFVAKNRTGIFSIKKNKIHERLTVVTPVFPIYYKLRIRLPFINELYQNWLFKRLRKTYGDYFVVNFDFTAHRIFRYFDPVIYYCNDECIGNTKYPNWFTDMYYKLSEQKIIRKSMFCVATTPYLHQKLSRINPKTFEIPLGANSAEKKATFRKINSEKIILGILGNITLRQISIDLINKIISNRNLHLVIIGTIEDAFCEKIASFDEVTITGVLTGNKLIDALSKIDIGIAFYNKGNINPGASPNKLWQYLSVGKPVIVSHLENLKTEIFPPKSVYVLKDTDTMETLIYQAYHDNSEELFKERINFIENNTWEKRIEKFLNILKDARSW